MTELTQYQIDQADAAEKRARWNEMSNAEDSEKKKRLEESERAFAQQQRERAARENEQSEKNAIAETERLKLVAQRNAEAAELAKRERDNYEWAQERRNASPEERAETNRRYVEESSAAARKHQAEAQARHEAAKRAEAEQLAQARKEFRERQQVHDALLQSQREIEEQKRLNPDYEAQGGTHMTCPVCGQVGISKAMPFHKSADFSKTCYWDLPRCLSSQILTEAQVREIESQRSAVTAK
jgi:hypothetical protein